MLDNEHFIDLRAFAFQMAVTLAPSHIDEDGVSFTCPEFDAYSASEEILSYILDGKIPQQSALKCVTEIKPELNNKNIN